MLNAPMLNLKGNSKNSQLWCITPLIGPSLFRYSPLLIYIVSIMELLIDSVS